MKIIILVALFVTSAFFACTSQEEAAEKREIEQEQDAYIKSIQEPVPTPAVSPAPKLDLKKKKKAKKRAQV